MRTNTLHSLERMKDRCNVKNAKAAERIVRLALERGKSADDFTSWERSYLDAEGRNHCRAIAYKDHCYIVNEENICVTVYRLPAWFGKKKHFNGKERIRNLKKYCRNNQLCWV